MARSFDFLTPPAPTYVLARVMRPSKTYNKMYCEIDIHATKSCIFIILIFFSLKPTEAKNTGFSSPDVKFTIHFIIVLARPPLVITLARTCVGAGGVKNIKGVSHLFIS